MMKNCILKTENKKRKIVTSASLSHRRSVNEIMDKTVN